MLFYSKSTQGFYDTSFHKDGTIPSDAVEISEAKHKALLDGNSNGKQITADANGYPILIEIVPTFTYSQLRANEYPPMSDYLDAVVKGDLVGQQTYIDKCLAVKLKYPKP